jgi:prepilin-type N-terminal cleavage/methylation domain-containing protein
MNRRRGFTLVEMVVVIATSGVLLGVAVSLLCALQRGEAADRQQNRRSTAVGRLAEQFRADVHAAIGDRPATDQDAGAEWRFDLSDQRSVVYRAIPGRVVRTEMRAEKLERRESYVLPPETTVDVTTETLRTDKQTETKIVSLSIIPAGKSAADLQVDAVPGQNHRWRAAQEPRDE